MGYIIAISILAWIFTFYMGYVDGTSAIASCIATHALKPRPALIVSTLAMLIAPVIMVIILKSDSVARTVSNLIESSSLYSVDQKSAFIFLLSTMIASILWAIIATIMVVPNSVSHTLLGGLVGAGISMFSLQSIDWNSVLIKVVLMVFLAPILGLILGFVLQKIFTYICRSLPRATKKSFKMLQGLNVILLSSSISANNIQKSMGIFLLGVVLCTNNPSFTLDTYQFSWWIIIVFALLQCLGLFFGGDKLINAVGNKLHRLSTVQSYVAQLSTIFISFASTFLGLPIATTQVVSSSIMGVGAAERIASVRWLRFRKILLSWFITFPVSLGFGYIICLLLKAIIL